MNSQASFSDNFEYQKGKWVYVEKTVLVQPEIKKLNIRIDADTYRNRGGNAWFDDIKIEQLDLSQNEIVSETNYYPFGLAHKGYNEHVSSTNKGEDYKFNGVELNSDMDLGLYEMDYRFYDPVVPRFTTIDPMAEQRYWMSPYNFGQNNPISRVDPTGLIDWVYDKDKEEYVWDANVTSADDVDLADNAEYVGVSRGDIDTHFKENNNWFASTFGDPDVDTKSFTDYVGGEMNKKIETFIETGETQRLDDIRGLYENSYKESHSGQIYIKFNLDINLNEERITGGYGITHLFKNKHLNIIDGASFSVQRFNGELAKIDYPYNIKFTSSRVKGRKPRAPIHLKIHKNSVNSYNKLYNYKQTGK